MPRIEALDVDELPPELADILEAGRGIMGFTPNDALTMARRPELLGAMLGLVQAVYAPGRVDPGFRKLLGLVASSATGCQYCVAHTAHSAHRAGVESERLAAIWDFETSPLFSEAERLALRFAVDASQVPNAVTDEDFARLRTCWDDDQLLEMLGVICLFGFLNRWNATLATALESAPLRFAGDALPASHWQPVQHVPGDGERS